MTYLVYLDKDAVYLKDDLNIHLILDRLKHPYQIMV